MMRIHLVNMPWAALDVPSLALGILRARAVDAVPEARVEVHYANLAFADWVARRLGYGVETYNHVAQATYFIGVGDWIFSSALYDDSHWREREFVSGRKAVMSAERIDQAVALHRLVPEFVAGLADQIVAQRPEVVGFTSTFQQNIAALAVARQVKRRRPATVTVFGGANCDGEQGAALHRNFPFVDFVCRGEAETAFPAMLAVLNGPDTGTDAYRSIPGLCWREPTGSRAVVNEMAQQPLPPGQIGAPDFTDFFDQLAGSSTGVAVEPRLVVEGSRGCWWGAKHHCTFCGLNGSSMLFRSKPAGQFRDELLGLVEKHRVLDVFVVDNILDMEYMSSFLPMLAEADCDLRMVYEIKSNLKFEQLELLRRSGASTVQPGIENLSSRVLQLMRKGVSGCQNVRLLRDAESVGLSVVWNYLYGFPGESADDYLPLLAQLPALHHLYPAYSAGRVAIERFSPYFTDGSLGFPLTSADRQYRIAYDLPTAELHDLAYLFEAEAQGIGASTAGRIDAAVRRWQQSYPTSRYCWYAHDDTVTLVNGRSAFDWSTRQLVDPIEVAAFRALEQPRTPTGLARAVAETVSGRVDAPERAGPFGAEEADDLLREWLRLGIVFSEDGRYIQVATSGDNQDLFHLGGTTYYQFQDLGR